ESDSRRRAMKRMPFADLSSPAKSLFVFGIYLLLLGALLVLAPNPMLALFRMAPTVEVWIRVVGMLVLVIGALDTLSALAELRAVMRCSVPLRAAVFLFLAFFCATGLGPTVIHQFGLIGHEVAC